jgi:hypothetical protein
MIMISLEKPAKASSGDRIPARMSATSISRVIASTESRSKMKRTTTAIRSAKMNAISHCIASS